MKTSNPWLENFKIFLNRFKTLTRSDSQTIEQDSDLTFQAAVKPSNEVVKQLPGTNIVIDSWKIHGDEEKLIRFMTIFRIEDDQLEYIKQGNYKIYTSCLNKKFLECHQVLPDRIVAIEPRSCVEISDENAGYSFRVSTIESNYCAGSCMFLFQGPFGNILYTGFFRPDESHDPLQDPNLEPLVLNKLITEVYIDNTYAAEHCQFPNRSNVIQKVVKLIKEHPSHKIIIAGIGFGKEEVLPDLTDDFDKNTNISESTYNVLLTIMKQSEPIFSLDKDNGRTILEDQLLSSLIQCEKRLAEGESSIIILLKTEYKCPKKFKTTSASQLSNVYIFPYSRHASHHELMHFLNKLGAHSIKPIILTKSKNTTIPQNMMDICRPDDISFIYAGFHFGASSECSNTENSREDTSEFLVSEIPILEWGTSCNPDADDITSTRDFNDNNIITEPIAQTLQCDVTDGSISRNIYQRTVLHVPNSSSLDCDVALEDGDTFVTRRNNTSRSHGTENDCQSQASFYSQVHCHETSTEDVSELSSSDRYADEHSQILFDDDELSEIEISENRDIENEGENSEEYSLQITHDTSDDGARNLLAILYHTCLVTEPDVWRGTNLTCDSWRFLEGADFQ